MSVSLRLTLSEYHAMIARGAFNDLRGRRIELISGELREMAPQGPWHTKLVRRLNRWSNRVLGEAIVEICVQQPITIAELDSEPEPDIAWAIAKPYTDSHPTPDDVLLLIEVSMATLADDLGENAELYARAGIADYWVIDIPHRLVHIFRQPSPAGFAVHEQHATGSVHPLAFPDIALEVPPLFAE